MPLQQPIRARRVDDRPDDYFNGIPNRDLTEDEYRALDADQRKVVRESGLWEVKTDAEIAPAVKRVERVVERATATAEKEAAVTEKGGEH
jgi:hypothetical protein